MPTAQDDPITLTYSMLDQRLFWKAARAACAPDNAASRDNRWVLKFVVWLLSVIAMVAALQLEVVQRGGIAFLIGLLIMWGYIYGNGLLQRRQMNKVMLREETRRGTVTAEFDPLGCRFNSEFGETTLNWFGINSVIDLGGATGLRSALVVYPIPDTAMPDGLTADEFRARLTAWHAAAQAT